QPTPRRTRSRGAFASSFGELSVLGDQAVLDGEHAGADAVGRTGLRVDVLDVISCRLRRNDEARGDLLRREPTREQAQDVDLARGEPGGSIASAPDAMPRRREDGLDRVGVEPARRDVLTKLGSRI